jgi:hypothetical protein
VKRIAVTGVFLLALILACDSGPPESPESGGRQPDSQASGVGNPDGLDSCEGIARIGRLAVLARDQRAVFEKEACSQDGKHGVYEAVLESGARFKVTFKSTNPHAGLHEICQDARTGSWECTDL